MEISWKAGQDMRFDKKQLLLYAVTDRSWLKERALSMELEEALKGGVTFVQLREKELEENRFLEEALKIKTLCRNYNVPFIINDNVKLALACSADGVHVGQSDMKASDVRALIGQDIILGVSVQTVEQAIAAEANGADYLGVGTVFVTATKADADFVSYETLKNICHAVSIPVVAIGGINEENIMELAGSGIAGVALVSAIFASESIKAKSKRMLQLSERVVKS